MSLEPEINKLISDNKTILIIQADNPDGDSLASSLALEQILHDLGKEPILYCAVSMPKHLKHLSGWDRVVNAVPRQFDISILVDCSSVGLLEIAQNNGELAWILAKPLIILDHHEVETTVKSTLNYNKPEAVATGEVIYKLAKELNWPLSLEASEMLSASILYDSLGLMTESTTATSIRIIADLVESGVNLAKLENARRETMKKSISLTKYKGELLQRIEYFNNDSIATITIPWAEIEQYSSQYNPSVLVLDEMRLVDSVKVAIAFKTYKDRRITAKIRANYGFPIAKDLAEAFGGGGHQYASGFKVIDKSYSEIKAKCIQTATKLLDKLSKENENEVN